MAGPSASSGSMLEEVIHAVRHVKHKKLEGTLYVMTNRIGWMNATAQTFRVSVNYDEIRVQKISPDTKVKVQLQLVLHDDATETFEFCNPTGRSESIRDRDSVKTHLLSLMQKSRTKLLEVERRARVLARDPRLFILYRDLVTTDVMNPEEFWKYYSDEAQILENVNSNAVADVQQPVGVSPGFLAAIRPFTDGTNTLRSTLTSDAIASIFSVFPHVRRKHSELVPAKMQEEEFWQLFFNSPYLHRDEYTPFMANSAKSGSSKADGPLTERAKQLAIVEASQADEAEAQRILRRTTLNPFADLGRSIDADWHVETTDDGDQQSTSHSQARLTAAQLESERNRSLIRRCNQYSTNIVRLVTQSTSAASRRTAETKATGSGLASQPIDLDDDADDDTNAATALSAKRAKLAELTTYEDLCNETNNEEMLYNLEPANQLRLNSIDTYRNGPLSGWAQLASDAGPSAGRLSASASASRKTRWSQSSNVRTAIGSWSRLRLAEPARSAAPVFATMGGVTVSNPSAASGPGVVKRELMSADEIWSVFGSQSGQVRSEMRSLYTVIFEMLTRFWRCFPLVDATLAERAQRTCTALRRFEQLKLTEFKSRWLAELKALRYVHAEQTIATLTAHVDRMLHVAFDKFDKWTLKQRQIAA